MNINQNIEFLRVIAINMLVFYHVALISGTSDLNTKIFVGLGRAGWIGTDLFLVIGGYFCGSFFLKNVNKLRVYLKYIINRLIRIVPSYLLFLILYLSIGVSLQNKAGNNFSLLEGYIASFLTFTANIKMAAGSWSGVALEGFFSISLAVQLFLVIGFLLFLLKKPGAILIMLLLMECSAILSRYFLQGHGNWFLYFFTITRMDAFLFGTALFTLYRYEKIEFFLRMQKNRLLLLSGILFLILAGSTTGLSLWLSGTHQIVYPILSLIFVLVVNYSIHSQPVKLIARLSNLGKLSYSIYLFKLPLIYFIYRILEKALTGTPSILFSMIFLFTGIAANYVAGTLWYYLIDHPLRGLLSGLLKSEKS